MNSDSNDDKKCEAAREEVEEVEKEEVEKEEEEESIETDNFVQELLKKKQILEEMLEYIDGAEEDKIKRLQHLKTDEERRRLLKETKDNEQNVFRGNTKGIYDLLCGRFYAHRRLNPSRKKSRNFDDFVFSKSPCSAPGEISVMMKGTELIMRPWNRHDIEIRFVTPDIIPACNNKTSKNTLNLNDSPPAPASRAVVARRRFQGRLKNQTPMGVGMGGFSGNTQSKHFPGGLKASDYPLEVTYNGNSRVPSYNTMNSTVNGNLEKRTRTRRMGLKSTKRR